MARCKVCKIKHTPRFNSLAPTCEEPSCMIEWAKKQREKEWKVEKKQIKESHKSHSLHQNELQVFINHIVRLIDYGLPCISCEKFGKMSAGHRTSVGANDSIRFHLHNEHIQCFQCNGPKSGNPDMYDAGLIRWYGSEYQQYVRNEIAQQYPIMRMSIPELIDAKQVSMSIIRDLKKEQFTRPAKERIDLRTKLNKQIGLYTFDTLVVVT